MTNPQIFYIGHTTKVTPLTIRRRKIIRYEPLRLRGGGMAVRYWSSCPLCGFSNDVLVGIYLAPLLP